MSAIVSVLRGGRGGSPFNDSWVAAGSQAPITSISVSFGIFINNVTVKYGDGMEVSHGEKSTNSATLLLSTGEYISSVEGSSGVLIDSLTFHTNKGRVFGPVGGSGGRPFSFNFGDDAGLVFLAGRSGDFIDALAFGYAKAGAGGAPVISGTSSSPSKTKVRAVSSQSAASCTTEGKGAGKTGGSGLSSAVKGDDKSSEDEKKKERQVLAQLLKGVRSVSVNHGDFINSVKVERNGDTGDTKNEKVETSEFIIPKGDTFLGMTGSMGETAIENLVLYTKKGIRSMTFGNSEGGKVKFDMRSEGEYQILASLL